MKCGTLFPRRERPPPPPRERVEPARWLCRKLSINQRCLLSFLGGQGRREKGQKIKRRRRGSWFLDTWSWIWNSAQFDTFYGCITKDDFRKNIFYCPRWILRLHFSPSSTAAAPAPPERMTKAGKNRLSNPKGKLSWWKMRREASPGEPRSIQRRRRWWRAPVLMWSLDFLQVCKRTRHGTQDYVHRVLMSGFFEKPLRYLTE